MDRGFTENEGLKKGREQWTKAKDKQRRTEKNDRMTDRERRTEKKGKREKEREGRRWRKRD